MTEADAKQILALVNGAYYQQPIDQITRAVWARILADVDYDAAREAVLDYAKSEEPNPPRPGQIRSLAIEIAHKHRQGRKALASPEPSPVEIEQNKRRLRDMIEQIGRKMGQKAG